MKSLFLPLTIILFCCNSSKNIKKTMTFPTGEYEVIALHDASYSPNTTYTLRINAETKNLGGKFDCNTFNVGYDYENQNIDFGMAMSTKMYCNEKMINENTFFKIIKNIKAYDYDGKTLNFYEDKGKILLELKRLDNE